MIVWIACLIRKFATQVKPGASFMHNSKSTWCNVKVKTHVIKIKQYAIKPDYLYGAIKIICIITSWKDYK